MRCLFRCLSAIVLVSLTATVCAAQTLSALTYGGSGVDSANSITTDAAGNIYVVGTTSSTDLPLLHPAQSVNAGTQLMLSPDAGATWKPLGNLPGAYAPSPFNQVLPVTIDPTNPAVFYAGFNGMIFKSTDNGQHFSASAAFIPQGTQIYSIAVDPSNPSNVYAGADVGVFKSTDGGATFANASFGLLVVPGPHMVSELVFDPHNPKSLWAVVSGVGFLSIDGAKTWSQLSLPGPAAGNASLAEFAFDAVMPGVVYAFGSFNGTTYLLKSADGGETWSQLSIPFLGGILAADPVRAGYLYAIASNGSPSQFFYRSADGGASWQSFAYPGVFAASLAVDPGNPNIVLAGSYRSTDNGQTWSPTAVSRNIQITFARTGNGVVFASGQITTDIFVAKFKPDGKTLEFATYYGGMGNETASGIALDKSGNIWVTGTTNSFYLPVSENAFQRQLKGTQNIFVAEFTPAGRLHAATYLGGSGTERATAISLSPLGEPWLYGETYSADFPFKNGIPATPTGNGVVFLSEISASISSLIYSAPVDDVTVSSRMTIDAEGHVLLTGTTYSSSFPTTPGVVHGNAPPLSEGLGKAFLIKLDGSGNTIFSTYFGGSIATQTQTYSELENIGVAVTTDSTGIYLAGNTSAADFPTTAGAYQMTLHNGCPYPSFAIDTGLIGIIYEYAVDDVFVIKLSPDGKTLLYSTLFGGSCYDRPTDIAVTGSGAIVVTGETNSADFPVVHPFQNAPAAENYESFLSVIGPDGSTLPFSTYLFAGSAPSLAINLDGDVEIAGSAGATAQSMTYSGAFIQVPLPMTHAYVANLNLSSPPAKLDLTGVLNAFSLQAGSIAPNEIIQLNVPDFQPAQDLSLGLKPAVPLGTSLGGAEVLMNGQPALVIAISRQKIVAIAPENLTVGPNATVQVNFNGALSNSLRAGTAPAALGLLSSDGSGTGPANARNTDGTSNSAKNPAKRGSRVTVYLTGAGVPPLSVFVGVDDVFGNATRVAPLEGFVPGIYAVDFDVPTEPGIMSPIFVSVQASGPDVVFGPSQTLLVYVD